MHNLIASGSAKAGGTKYGSAFCPGLIKLSSPVCNKFIMLQLYLNLHNIHIEELVIFHNLGVSNITVRLGKPVTFLEERSKLNSRWKMDNDSKILRKQTFRLTAFEMFLKKNIWNIFCVWRNKIKHKIEFLLELKNCTTLFGWKQKQ